MKKHILFFAVFLFLSMPAGLVAQASYTPPSDTASQAVLMINSDTETVVYAKNPDQKMYPASTTKIMTAVVALETFKDNLDQEITASKTAISSLYGTSSSAINIKIGETLTVRQLLYAMLISSANDAAAVLADYIGGGSQSAFVEKMNQKAAALGCTNTHFANPHGLHDENHYTTANDMMKIVRYAMTLPLFPEIVSTTRYQLPQTNKSALRTLVTTNLMMDNYLGGTKYYYEYVKGIKTGKTTPAGNCFVSTASKDGFTYYIVSFGAPVVDEKGASIADNNSFLDAKMLYKWAFSSLQLRTIVKADEPVAEVPLQYAWDQDHVKLVPKNDVSYLLPNQISTDSLQRIVNTDEKASAPVKQGEKYGTMTIMLAGEKIADVDLVAAESVERSNVLFYFDKMQQMADSIWIKVLLGAVVAVVLVYIGFSVIHNRARKRRGNYKLYSGRRKRR